MGSKRPFFIVLPSAKHLNTLLTYDARTGILRWRIARGAVHAGAVAGTFRKDGRRVICIDQVDYYAARIAWKMYYGNDPKCEVDHEDMDRGNNRINNLREASHRQNKGNANTRVDNTSGFKGVSWSENAQKWRAYIAIKQRFIHIGYYASKRDAARAYDEIAVQVFGEFAKTNF